MKVKALQRSVTLHLAKMGKLRDEIDKTLDAVQEQKDVIDRAIESLEESRDALSEIV